MNKHISINRIVVSTLGASALFLLTATLAAPTEAAAVDVASIPAATTAPVQLAWWNGYYNRGPYWRGGYRYAVCPRVCWRGAWGYLHCERRC